MMAGYVDSCARTWRVLAVAALAATAAAGAQAGYITTNEAGMDAIYSQSSFGSDTVDIRFDAPRTIFSLDLATIDAGDFGLLQGKIINPYPVVSMFFVDSVNDCGGSGGAFIGCSSLTGNIVAVDSSWAANAHGAYGAWLLAHELGHNLGLDHVFPDNGSNLMNQTVSTNFGILTSAQVETILGSGLIQTTDSGQRFIEIAPIAVLASVPEVPTSLMLSSGLALAVLGARRPRRRQEA
jgi:hypothetical protein